MERVEGSGIVHQGGANLGLSSRTVWAPARNRPRRTASPNTDAPVLFARTAREAEPLRSAETRIDVNDCH